MKKWFKSLFLLFFLTGCSRYTEINQLGIVEVFSITKKKNIEETASMIIPKKEEMKYQLITSKGTSLGNAFLNLQKEEEREVYFDQSQVLLLNQKILKEEVEKVIPFLLTHFKHPNWLTFLCEDCDAILHLEKTKTFYENLIRKEHTKAGNIAVTTFEDFASFYLDESLTAYLPFLEIQDNKVTLQKLIAFTNDKRFISFTKEEAKIFFLLKEKMDHVERNISIANQSLSLSLFNLQSNITLKNGKVIIKITGSMKRNDTASHMDDQKVKNKVEKKLEQEIKKFLQKEKEEDVDLLGTINLLYKTERNLQSAIKKWKKIEEEIQINLKKEGDIH